MNFPFRYLLLGLLLVTVYACTPDDSDQESDQELTELQQINRAIESDPANAENFARRARIHRAAGNHGDAIVDMAEAMRRDSVNEQYHHLLADLYMESAKSQFAIGTMERSAMLFPDSIKTWLKMAELKLIVRKYDQAAAALKEAMTLDPQSTEALHLLGIMYREQNNPERAIQTYQTIVELDSEDTEAWIALGNLYDMQGDARALQCFENAIAAAPGYPQALHSKAFYLQNHRRIPEAIELYKRIHALDSTYAEAWLNRGILYIEMDSAETALRCFEEVVQIDSTVALGWYYAGVAAQELGDVDQARLRYSRALELAPGSPRVMEKLESLD